MHYTTAAARPQDMIKLGGEGEGQKVETGRQRYFILDEGNALGRGKGITDGFSSFGREERNDGRICFCFGRTGSNLGTPDLLLFLVIMP
jgi:hypothetical protein